MRVSLSALALIVVLSGCGTTAALGTQPPVTASVSALSAAVAQDVTWNVTDARYGGGDGEGMIWVDLDSWPSVGEGEATQSVFLAFTDEQDFNHDLFRYVTVDGQRLAPGSSDFAKLQTELADAYVAIGIDDRIVNGASTLLARATKTARP